MEKKTIVGEFVSPEGVEITLEKSTVTVKGKNGTISRDFTNPRINIQLKNEKITINSLKSSKREKALVNTYVAHLKNMANGVLDGYVYKLKICSGHFPMNVAVNNGELVIKNFIGEKTPRKVKLHPDVKVTVDSGIVVVEGPNKEVTGQTAANIEQITRRPGFDKRIFQDGIHITHKAGKEIK